MLWWRQTCLGKRDGLVGYRAARHPAGTGHSCSLVLTNRKTDEIVSKAGTGHISSLVLTNRNTAEIVWTNRQAGTGHSCSSVLTNRKAERLSVPKRWLVQVKAALQSWLIGRKMRFSEPIGRPVQVALQSWPIEIQLRLSELIGRPVQVIAALQSWPIEGQRDCQNQ